MDLLDVSLLIIYNQNVVFPINLKKSLPYIYVKVFKKEVHRYENDLSAQKKTEIQSSRIQKKNEYPGR